MLKNQVGGLFSINSMANKLQAHGATVKEWIYLLENLNYCFSIKPWHKNIARSLIKESKIYLNDWSLIDNQGARFENFIAVHLYKTISLWNDLGLGEFNLHI